MTNQIQEDEIKLLLEKLKRTKLYSLPKKLAELDPAQVVKVLRSFSLEERAKIIRALGEIRDNIAIPIFAEMLQDAYWQDEIDPIIHALGKFDDPQAIEHLKFIANSPDVDVRKAAEGKLVELKVTINQESTSKVVSKVSDFHKRRKRISGLKYDEDVVKHLMSSNKFIRQNAIRNIIQSPIRKSLANVEEALARLADNAQIEFYRVGGLQFGTEERCQGAYETILDFAKENKLLEDPPHTQSLIALLGSGPIRNLSDILMDELNALNQEVLRDYQLLGIQMQLAIQVG